MLAHLVIALGLQLAGRLVFRSWQAGAFAAAAWAISREISQAEYRWIELYGAGRRANMPWWGAFDLRVWQKLDPWLDWLLPCAAVTIVALAARTAKRQRAPGGSC